RFASFDLRSPNRIQPNFAVESFIDELAATAGLDPIEFRLRQLQNTRPIAAALSPALDQSNYTRAIQTLTTLRDAMKWQTRPSPNPGARGKGDVVPGRGVATMGNYHNMFGSIGAEVEVDKLT